MWRLTASSGFRCRDRAGLGIPVLPDEDAREERRKRKAAPVVAASCWERAESLIEPLSEGLRDGRSAGGQGCQHGWALRPSFRSSRPVTSAVVVLGAFDAPAIAAAGEPLAAGEHVALERGDKNGSRR